MTALVQGKTRGERNANPGNLRYSPEIPWQGLAEPPHDDGGYCIFRTSIMGIRAIAKDLLSKWHRGLRTVRQIIDVYAPPSENDTSAYISDVCERLGVGPDDDIDLSDNAALCKFVRAIIQHENGRILYQDDTIGQAVSMALMP